MQLFIDTNIFLSLYHFTADDLEELEKLRVLLKQSMITLLLPRQVMHEFARNRDNKVAEAIRQLREQKLRAEFPQLCKDYAEYPELRSLQQQFETLHSTLCETIAADAIARKLRADSTIDGLFAVASPIEEGPEILQSARDRMDRGTPPGKRDSLGDAINWVSLLEAATEGDLYVVTGDKDFVSPLDETSMNSFLCDEWRDQKAGDVHFFRYLSRFFNDHFPDIKLTSELAKEELLSRLATSPSFASTHALVHELKGSEYSAPDRSEILAAVTSNDQIYGILGDPDVGRFVEGVMLGHEDEIDPEVLTRLLALKERFASDQSG